MRRVVMAVIVAGALVPSYAAAADTVQGELVTIMCVAKNGDKGQGTAHVDCAIDCAKKGYPLAILTADGTITKSPARSLPTTTPSSSHFLPRRSLPRGTSAAISPTRPTRLSTPTRSSAPGTESPWC